MFERIGIKKFEDSIAGLNVDRASVNNGRKRGLECILNKMHDSWSLSIASTIC